MRENKICQLCAGDVIEVDDIWCVNANWSTKDKKRKSSSAKRTIHPHLIKIGFLDYVARMRRAKAPRLWMQLKLDRDGYGRAISRWFTQYKAEKVTDDDNKVFHSLRHTVTDELKQNGVQEVLMPRSQATATAAKRRPDTARPSGQSPCSMQSRCSTSGWI